MLNCGDANARKGAEARPRGEAQGLEEGKTYTECLFA